MANIMKWSGVALGSILLLLVLAAPAVQAQDPYFQVRPGLTPQQYYNMTLYGRAAAMQSPYSFGYGYGWGPYAGYSGVPAGAGSLYSTPYSGLGSTASMTSTPYGGGYNPGSYYPPYQQYYYDPYGGYLRGGADVIDSQGRFLVSIQQANLVREQVRAERMRNRRQAFEDYLYMRDKTPTLEQERERNLAQLRERARTDPPVTEVWSGKALNDILGELRAMKSKGQLVASRAPNLPLDEDLLKHINVTGKEGGNLGLLKNDGRLAWPAALTTDAAKTERERLNELAQNAVGQAKTNNAVDAGTLKQIQTDVETLHRMLSKNVGDLPPAQYIEARRFLNNFDDALKVLGGSNPGNYATRKWGAKGKNVGDLVQNMLDSGLQFAPAVAGEEAAYVALHRALATYGTAMQTQVATEQPRQP